MVVDFTIDPEYLTSVSIREEWNMYTKDDRVPTAEEVLLILQGKGECAYTSSDDHAEFTKLREQLSELGYIHIQRSWWNGDEVLKPFTLNGRKFKVGAKFASAGAMGNEFQVRANHPEYYADEDDST